MILHHAWRFLLPLLLFLAPSALAQGHVLVVDAQDGPGTDYTDLSQALAAAQPGDTLLLKTGVYADPEEEPFLLDGKGLSLVADGVVIIVGLEVKNLPAGETALLRGIHFQSPFFFYSSLGLRDNLGSVWVEDCMVESAHLSGAVTMINCSNVVLSHVTTQAAEDFSTGNSTIIAESSHLHLYECTISGAKGKDFEPDGGGGSGENALELWGGFATVANSILAGGDGGNGILGAGQGGHGIWLRENDPQVVEIGSTFSGGEAGVSDFFPAPDGEPRHIESGSLQAHDPILAGRLDLPSPIRAGQNFTTTFSNLPPGGYFLLGLAGTTAPSGTNPGNLFASTFVLGPPLDFIPIGFVDATGSVVFQYAWPDLSVAESLVGYIQGFVFDPGQNTLAATTPSSIVILRSDF